MSAVYKPPSVIFCYNHSPGTGMGATESSSPSQLLCPFRGLFLILDCVLPQFEVLNVLPFMKLWYQK